MTTSQLKALLRARGEVAPPDATREELEAQYSASIPTSSPSPPAEVPNGQHEGATQLIGSENLGLNRQRDWVAPLGCGH